MNTTQALAPNRYSDTCAAGCGDPKAWSVTIPAGAGVQTADGKVWHPACAPRPVLAAGWSNASKSRRGIPAHVSTGSCNGCGQRLNRRGECDECGYMA